MIKKTAASLLLGSDEMNRMRHEIHRVVTFLLGSFNSIRAYDGLVRPETKDRVFEAPDKSYEWVFGRAANNLYFEFRVPDNRESTKLIFSSFRASELHNRCVKQVHAELDFLVVGMCKEYQYLREALEPFFEMAKDARA